MCGSIFGVFPFAFGGKPCIMLSMIELIAAIAVVGASTPPRPAIENWWDAKVEASLARNPERRPAWEAMLVKVPESQRPGMSYLMAFLPLLDLNSLPPAQLLENTDLAYRARAATPWAKAVPEDVFFDSVLPHANITENRHPWRQEFFDKYLPKVRGAKSAGEAALILNKTLFTDYKVSYNTRRLRTDQSPKETIEQGMATCTGLSIMLVDACRAVGVPARMAGITAWPVRGGNHTWVEVWDNGWHFVGAAEPDEKGLNHAWFVEDAAKAIADIPQNAIWAVTYRETDPKWPSVFDRRRGLNAENVTARYRRPDVSPLPRLMVEVKEDGQRVEADVEVWDRGAGTRRVRGRSLGPQSDINLHYATPVLKGEAFVVVARHNGKTALGGAKVDQDTVVRLDLGKPAEKEPEWLKEVFADRFHEDDAKREAAAKLLKELPFDVDAKKLAWDAYRASPLHAGLKKDFDAKIVRSADRSAPYLWRTVGEKPADGWAMVVAMHGGGATPKEVNDRSWRGMFERYYRDHPDAGGYVYLALRAPNDEWNGFYDDAICPMFENLIKQFVLFADVNPDRVTITGASHGGYGAFVIGPKIPDRFSAVHASAAAPTDGETRGENLRNVRFSWMVGERDTAYGRAERCQAFAKKVEEWRAKWGGFDATFEWLPGVGHSVPDRDKAKELVTAKPRNAWPKHLVWFQSDDRLKSHYWLEAEKPIEAGFIEAIAEGNTIKVTTENQAAITLWLDSSLVDLSKPVTVIRDGRSHEFRIQPSMEVFCAGIEQRADPSLAGVAKLTVPGS